MLPPVFQGWVDTTGTALTGLWATVIGFLPALIGSLVILVFGLIVASLLEKFVERVVFYLKIDSVLRKAEFEGYLERANMKLNTGKFFGKLVYWFIAIVALLAAADNLGFNSFSDFLRTVLAYIPNVIMAALIMLVALVAANFVRGLVAATVASAKLHHGKGIAAFSWWAIVVVGFVAALDKVGVNTGIIQALVYGLIAMLALAGGLAFGLGGREHASRFLGRWTEEFKK